MLCDVQSHRQPPPHDPRTYGHAFHAHFQPLVETGKDVLLVQDLAIGYEKVLSTVEIDLKKGDKIGILGGNGLGKSTFLKTIVGQIPPLGGTYQYGTNVQIGYFDQQMAMYTSNKTVLDDFWDVPGTDADGGTKHARCVSFFRR